MKVVALRWCSCPRPTRRERAMAFRAQLRPAAAGRQWNSSQAVKWPACRYGMCTRHAANGSRRRGLSGCGARSARPRGDARGQMHWPHMSSAALWTEADGCGLCLWPRRRAARMADGRPQQPRWKRCLHAQPAALPSGEHCRSAGVSVQTGPTQGASSSTCRCFRGAPGFLGFGRR